jgi:2-dehydropantoate 2-reductase
VSLTITILGAGAIGSLLGAFLSTQHKVTLLCRAPHANAIQQNGLKITGSTNRIYHPQATPTIKSLPDTIDLAIITVKAYHTQQLIKKAKPILQKAHHILTLQNGLGNIETIAKTIPSQKILAGITTHGALFEKPGTIKHTGIGRTKIGPVCPSAKKTTQQITQILTKAGLPTTIAEDIRKEIWKKVIINSAINPLTTIFQCTNGYLLENPILEHILTTIIIESTEIANTQNYHLHHKEMITQTIKVIHETTHNYSSMLQSIQQNQQTEIDYINGAIKTTAQQQNTSAPLNTLITNIIKRLSYKQ